MRKHKIIIDSDTANEIDDAFAIAYAFACRDKFDIKAITIAPFSVHYKSLTTSDGLIESKIEANRILRLVGVKEHDFVCKGANDFMSNGYMETNPAVEKIIAEAKKGKLTIVGLGVLTNIAVALTISPSIAKNLEIIWLGTRHLFYDKFDDVNYINDKKAFEIVLKSQAKMTIIPSYIGKFISTSEQEVKARVAVNDIGRYLYKIMHESQFNASNYGVRTFYDLAPVAYLVNPKWFATKEIEANDLLKEQTKIESNRKVNYVYDMASHAVVWVDFVQKISELGNLISPSRTFFISDTHLGDYRTYKIKQTPFMDGPEMDREIVTRWNRVVSDKDTVYHLGDFGDYTLVKKLKGKIILICGNYEKKEYQKDFPAFREKLIKLGFADVIQQGVMLEEDVLGEPVYLTHQPSHCQEDSMNLFGHVHSIKPLMHNGINVAAPYHGFTPVSDTYIRKQLLFLHMYADSEVFIE